MSERMPGDEAVKIVASQTETSEIVPAAHILSRRGQTGHLAEHLQKAVIVEIQETGYDFRRTGASSGHRATRRQNKERQKVAA